MTSKGCSDIWKDVVGHETWEAVAAPLTGGMQILKVGKMVSLVGADEDTFQRAPVPSM